MKKIKLLVVMTMVIGGIGAKVGEVVGTSSSNLWAYVENGFLIGGGIGLFVAGAIIMSNEKVFRAEE